MHKLISAGLKNLILVLLSLLVFTLILELLVFRFIFPASDVAVLYPSNNVIRYQPNQSGTYRIKNEIAADFRINAEGWNSKYDSYKNTPKNDKTRIVIIGDSYVSAFNVNYKSSFAEHAETNLGSDKFQVFRFGIPGSPLSQYLHVLRQEALKYDPDIIVINAVHNDFSESYEFAPTTISSAFMKVNIENGAVTQEIIPKIYSKKWYSLIQERSTTWKFLSVRQKVRFSLLRDFFLGGNKYTTHKPVYEGNIDISRLEEQMAKNITAARYILGKVKEICLQKNIRLIVQMGADDMAIYKAANLDDSSKNYLGQAVRLNNMMDKLTSELDIEFINHQPVFAADFEKNRTRFDFPNDGHWNVHAHKLVAKTLANRITSSK